MSYVEGEYRFACSKCYATGTLHLFKSYVPSTRTYLFLKQCWNCDFVIAKIAFQYQFTEVSFVDSYLHSLDFMLDLAKSGAIIDRKEPIIL